MNIYKEVFSKSDSKDIAIQYKSKTISYNDLTLAIQNTACVLKNEYIKNGSSTLLLLPNCPEFIISFFAISYIGGISVLVDTKLNKELLQIIKENNIQLVITDNTGVLKIKKIIENSQDKNEIILLNPLVIIDKQMIWEFSKQNYNNILGAPVDDGDIYAMVLYTSGSESKPKGVINSHRTLIEALDNYIHTLPITKQDKFLAVIPFFHSYAFGSCMLAGLAVGATLVVEEEFQPRKIIKLITQENISIFQGVPYMYDMINQYFDCTVHNFRNVRYFISAGAPLHELTQIQFFNKTTYIIHQEYGSSETGTLCLNLSNDMKKNISSVGKPLKNVIIELQDEDNGKGVICVKKQGCGVGYINGKRFTDSWYATEDIGAITEDGYIEIYGRKNRMINISGLKINPEEVETCIKKHDGIHDVLVTAMDDESGYAQNIKAFVIKSDKEITTDMLIKHCQANLALYKVPVNIEWVSSLPKSALGKTRSI